MPQQIAGYDVVVVVESDEGSPALRYKICISKLPFSPSIRAEDLRAMAIYADESEAALTNIFAGDVLVETGSAGSTAVGIFEATARPTQEPRFVDVMLRGKSARFSFPAN